VYSSYHTFGLALREHGIDDSVPGTSQYLSGIKVDMLLARCSRCIYDERAGNGSSIPEPK
jgi:hypothetical protein